MKRSPEPRTIDAHSGPEAIRVLLQIDPTLQEAWAAALREADAAAQVEALTAVFAQFAKQEEAVRQAIPLLPKNSREFWDFLWRFSIDRLGFSAEELRLEATHTEWLSRYRGWVSNLKATQKRPPGRHEKEQTKDIYDTWIQLGKPSLTRALLAQKFLGSQYTTADAAGRRRLRDRCRMAAIRFQKKATKSGLK